jgi:hypothetical protein
MVLQATGPSTSGIIPDWVGPPVAPLTAEGTHANESKLLSCWLKFARLGE